MLNQNSGVVLRIKNFLKKFFDNYNTLHLFLYLIGIRSFKPKSPSSCLKCLNLSITILFHLGILYKFIQFGEQLIFLCSDFQCKKANFSRILWRIGIYGSWLSLQIKRKNLINVFVKFQSSHIAIRQSYNRLANVAFLLYSTFTLALLISIIYVTVFEEMLANSLLSEIIFLRNVTLHSPLKEISIVSYYVPGRIMITTTVWLLTLFYAAFSITLSKLLKECSLFITQQSIAYFVPKYEFVHDLVISSENALSMNAFFLCCSYFIELSQVFANALGFWAKAFDDVRLHMQAVIFTALSCVGYFIVAFSAAKVGKEDEILRKKVKRIAFELSLSNKTKMDGKVLLNFLNSREKLVLTAWSMFPFTTHFLLASIGILSTYNLLIIQIDIDDKNYS